MTYPKDLYQQQIEQYTHQREILQRKQRWIPYLRVFFFVAALVFLYRFISDISLLDGLLFALFLISFVMISILGLSYSRRIKRLDLQLLINQHELDALQGDFTAFDIGKEFVDHDHPYTHDLDIFGKHSLFNCINRTETLFGKRRLADYFNHAYEYSKDILKRQEAIQELAAKTAFRQELQLIFMSEKTSGADLDELNHWLKAAQQFKHASWIKIGLSLCSTATITAIVMSALGLLSFQIPLFMVVMQFILVAAFGRKIMKTYHGLTSNFKIIEKYASALALIETTEWSAPYLQQIRTLLHSDPRNPPSRIIAKLASILNWMDSNLNMLVAAILNGLFMHNLHMLIAVDQWKKKYASLIPAWFDILAEMEALSSLATFTFNRPSYVFPVPENDEFLMVAKQLGHPLLPPDECVTNDIEIKGWKQYAIVTGANMSGKSTFLRSVGINAILAQVGAPVFATSMHFFPIQIHSSIRTNDSLAKRESYFFAELKRLKQIIDELEQGQTKFILLDEILKGTNSSDKQTGSIALIKQLLHYRSVGIFATHDLALGGLIDHYPDHITNLCFEIAIKGDKMQIDYKLQQGICKNLNATFLMKNMGILIDAKN